MDQFQVRLFDINVNFGEFFFFNKRSINWEIWAKNVLVIATNLINQYRSFD